MSPEARAQATIAIGANVEWRRARAVAAALKIDAIVQHKKYMSLNLESKANAYVNAISEPPEISMEVMDNCTAVELDDREDCSVAAYQVEVESFVIADKELDDAESLTLQLIDSDASTTSSDKDNLDDPAWSSCDLHHFMIGTFDVSFTGLRISNGTWCLIDPPELVYKPLRGYLPCVNFGLSSGSQGFKFALNPGASLEFSSTTGLYFEMNHWVQSEYPLLAGYGGDSDSESLSRLQQPPQPPAAAATTYDYRDNTSHSTQHPPVSDATPYNFQLSHSQEFTASGSRYPPPASIIPAPAAPYMAAYQEPACGDQYRSLFPVTSTSNIAAYNNPNSCLQEHVGSTIPSSQPELQLPTGERFYQAVHYPHNYSASNTGQDILQESAPQTFQNSTSFEAQTGSSVSSLEANVPNDKGCRPTDPQHESMRDQTRHMNQSAARGSQPEYQKVACGSPYRIPSSSIPSSTQQGTKPKVTSSVINGLKVGSSNRMTASLFEDTLYPSNQKNDELAKAAVDNEAAVDPDEKDGLVAWILQKGGQNTISQLKRTFKKLHEKSRCYAEGFVSGAYCLSFETFRNATDIAPSRKARATFLLSSYDFLDKLIELTAENGQTLWFRTPFTHPGVTGMVEYMLCTQQFRQHVKLTSPNWESRLINVFALAGTFCRWVVSRYSVQGCLLLEAVRIILSYAWNEQDRWTSVFLTIYAQATTNLVYRIGGGCHCQFLIDLAHPPSLGLRQFPLLFIRKCCADYFNDNYYGIGIIIEQISTKKLLHQVINCKKVSIMETARNKS
ncbi:hypothetical protein CY34DRAFT_110495 [Suillus luteus UH-Slu-Lm8-n1]|uniref:Uncharacterized protein n=1 Tax=Suillus luteus UH-Slu-Lm8-n1 TaxID=930992 RepID=A0A0D0AHX1_9AGAM|nr:hypothetical protein CY34DRAFT_110495 [Suillus luteus UH-Slu-Lm8-n1]